MFDEEPDLNVWNWLRMSKEDYKERIETRTCPAEIIKPWDGSVGDEEPPCVCEKSVSGESHLCAEHYRAWREWQRQQQRQKELEERREFRLRVGPQQQRPRRPRRRNRRR